MFDQHSWACAGSTATRSAAGSEAIVSRFDRYNGDARRSLAQAREIALRLNHKTICTEHLLYGLLEANDQNVNLIISGLGVNSMRLRQALDFVIGKSSRPLLVEPTLSTAARRALDLAEEEAQAEQSTEVGSEPLLMALLPEGERIAPPLLETSAVSLTPVH